MDEPFKNFNAFEKVEELLQNHKHKMDFHKIDFLRKMKKKNYQNHKSYAPIELNIIHQMYKRYVI